VRTFRATGSELRSAYPTFVVALLLNLVGLLPMHLQTRNAARRGVRTDRYWRAFVAGAVLNLVAVAGVVVAVVLVLRSYLG
jgi:hypothetical protein